MKGLFLFLLICSNFASRGQIISEFTWDADPVTTATVGPNAISVSSSAVSSINGVGGTNGLNPGTPGQNVDLTLTGSPYFDIPAIDIAVDFRKEENQASFYTRVPNFDFGESGGLLYVKFQVTVGASKVTINSGGIYTIAGDHAFHNYRFLYNNTTGTANLYVDGTVVYTYNGVANRSLYWTGAGDVVIGSNMDANGANISVLDNMIIQNPVFVLLPVKLLSFTAAAGKHAAVLNWTTSQEMNSAGFEAERSADGKSFAAVKRIAAAGQYNIINNYQWIDSAATGPVSYYRLKMINSDGTYTHSAVQAVNFGVSFATIHCFPNPATDMVTLSIENAPAAAYTYTVAAPDGKILQTSAIPAGSNMQNIPVSLATIPIKGLLIIQLLNNSTHEQQSFKIIRH